MYTMKQACEATGMNYEALKFYCNEGLVPNVKRDKINRRVFDEHDIAWIKSLSCLKKCGMSLTDMKRYLALCLEGKPTIPERQTMLEEKESTSCKSCRRFRLPLIILTGSKIFITMSLAAKSNMSAI